MTQNSTAKDAPASPEMAPRLVFLLALAAGAAVSSLYLAQPLLGLLANDLNASALRIGLVPTLTLLGYALGIFLLVPLGDRHDRRQVIAVKFALLVSALLAVGLAPSLPLLLAASLAIGMFATLAQDIVPAAAALAPDARRGKVVGSVMTGLLLGILLSRVVSGVVAEQWGWRSVFFGAALAVALIGYAVWRGLPRFIPSTHMRYGALLASLGHLFQRHAALRRAALAQGLISAAFSAFWSTLAVMLHGAPFHLGSAVAGAFGLAGAAGALAAPLAGHLADRRGAAVVTRLGTGLTTLSFALMALAPQFSTTTQLVLLVITTVGFDLGMQVTLIGHQSIVYGIDPDARSRLNAVLFIGMFVGMASGAAAGSALLAQWGWSAVTLLATLLALAAFALRCSDLGVRARTAG